VPLSCFGSQVEGINRALPVFVHVPSNVSGYPSNVSACGLCRYSVQAVGLAFAVTCATVFGAFFVAAFTKMDLTKAGGFLLAILFGVIAMSIIGIFWRNKYPFPLLVLPRCHVLYCTIW
jgi:FtsH-binding integral membrane protein